MEGGFSAYFFIRLFIGTLDLLTDILQAGFLMHDHHLSWGWLTLLIPLVSVILSLMSVCTGRIVRGESMSAPKFLLLALTTWAHFYGAIFQSGPQMLLQTTAVWRGVVDLKAAFKQPTASGIIGLTCMTSSLVSVVVSAMHFNDDLILSQGQKPAKFFLGLGVVVSSVLFRMFLASLLCAVTPYWLLGLVITFYLVHLIVFKATKYGGCEALLFSFTCLMWPSGHSRNLGDSSGVVFNGLRSGQNVTESVSEVKRAKINQEMLLKRSRISHGMFCLLNIILFIVFSALVEVHLFSASYKSVLVIRWATDRLVIYMIPVFLVILSTLFSFIYVYHVKTLRDAVRTWDAITPAAIHSSRSTTSSSSRGFSAAQIDTGPVNSPTHGGGPPPPYEAQMPLNPNFNETTPQRKKPGNVRCDRDNCVACELLVIGTTFRSTMTGKEYRYMPHVSCGTKNVIYLVTCSKCKKQYVGKTEQELRQRHYGHRREIDLQSSPLGKHFADVCGYTSWTFQIIDHTDSSDGLHRREGYWQHELMTLLPWGLNTRDELSGVDVAALQQTL